MKRVLNLEERIARKRQKTKEWREKNIDHIRAYEKGRSKRKLIAYYQKNREVFKAKYYKPQPKWICLYKGGMIFSEPVEIKKEELEEYKNMYLKTKLELRVIHPKKAKAILKWVKYSHGRVHDTVIDGIKIEAFYPTCADILDHEEDKISEHELYRQDKELMI